MTHHLGTDVLQCSQRENIWLHIQFGMYVALRFLFTTLNVDIRIPAASIRVP